MGQESSRYRERIRWPSARFLKRKALRLVRHPIFLFLTVCGNLLIASGAVALYIAERHHNDKIQSLLDTVWWAVSTVTTVGYGDISPITPIGKIIGIVLMIFGTALFWSYTALFAEALFSDEFDDFSSELRIVEKRLNALRETQENTPHDTALILARIEQGLRELHSDKQNRSGKKDSEN